MLKEKILNAGLEIWREHGLDKVNLRSIAVLVNITHPAILYHFKSVEILKDEIAKHAIVVNDVKVIQHLIVSDHECVRDWTAKKRRGYMLKQVHT